MITTLILDRIA